MSWPIDGSKTWVYIARDESLRFIKIGITTAPQRKLSAVRSAWMERTGSGEYWHFLTLVEGGLDDERRLHAHFAPLRVSGGEWYACDPSIVKYARDCSFYGLAIERLPAIREMVDSPRLERGTFPVSGERSNQLSYESQNPAPIRPECTTDPANSSQLTETAIHATSTHFPCQGSGTDDNTALCGASH